MVKLSFRIFLLSGSLMALTASSIAQSPAGQSPDNTGMNQADRTNDRTTADQQQKDPSDRNLTERIRRSIIAVKSLSTDAHNVKVIARGGQVTLKGPVRSENEKRTVEAKAAEVAGEDKVTSELTIKPQK